jgi:hypothetical protein
VLCPQTVVECRPSVAVGPASTISVAATGVSVVATATRTVGVTSLEARQAVRMMVFSGVEGGDGLMVILIRRSRDRGKLGGRWGATAQR